MNSLLNSLLKILSLTILIIAIFATFLAGFGTVAVAYNIWDIGLVLLDKTTFIMLSGGVVCVAGVALSGLLLIKQKYPLSSLVSILVVIVAVFSLFSSIRI